MGEAVAALLEFFALIVELFIELLAWTLEGLGFAAVSLSKKPKEGEKRFSAKRLLLAFAPLTTFILVIVLLYLYFTWGAEERRVKTEQTRQIVSTALEDLVEESGNQDPPEGELTVPDAWGNPLRVTLKGSLVHRTIQVSSNGPDGKPGNLDDITSRHMRMLSKKKIAKGAVGKAKDVLIDKLSGSMKESAQNDSD